VTPPGEWAWHPRMFGGLGLHRLVRMPGSHEVIFSNPTGLADKIIEADRSERPFTQSGGIMSFFSPFPDVIIPDISVYDYLFGDLDEADDGIALVDVATKTELSYGELVKRIDAFAGALAQRGMGVGDVVGLVSTNSSAFARTTSDHRPRLRR
jgi:hypothetical protein